MTPFLLAVADVADQTVTQWIVGVVALGIITVLGALLKHAVTGLTSSVEANTRALEVTKAELLTKLDALRDQVSRADGDRRVLEAELRALVNRVDHLEQQMHEAAEGIAR